MLFLRVSVSIFFWMRLTMGLVDSVKQISLPNAGGLYPICWEPEYSKIWKKRNPPFFPASVVELGHLISSSPALTLGFTSLIPRFSGFSTPTEFIPLAFLGHQLADGRLWDFSVPVILWEIPHNKSPFEYIVHRVDLFLWRTIDHIFLM